jgi:hypothetical protein
MLASNSESLEDREITLKEFLEEQRRLELDAAAALPYKFDQCTFKLGPLRQYIHICHQCPNYDSESELKAFCYSCAVSCHDFSPEEVDKETKSASSHKIEEIWSRRNFVCDCPSTGKCRLIKPLEYENNSNKSHVNSYNRRHNFKGKYCFCEGAGWTAGDRTMYQCEVCEDWFHDNCVARKRLGDAVPLVIPEEDSFEDFICCQCIEAHQDVFSQLKCTEMIFGHPKLNQPLDAPNASLFLNGAWRLEMRREFEKNERISKRLKSHNLEHLIRDEEQVYNTEEDEEANASLYERKETNQ